MNAHDVMLFIDPFSHHFERDVLFEHTPRMKTEAEEILAPFIHLRQWFADRGIRVHTADRLERREAGGRLNVVMSFGLQERCKQLAKRKDVVQSAFFAFESPVVEPSMYTRLPETADFFKRVYSFSDSESLQPLIRRPMNLKQFCLPYPLDDIREEVWRRDNRRFLVMINQNKLPALRWNELYTQRPIAVEFFSRYGEIDLYGVGWNEVPFQMGKTWKPAIVQRVERFFRNQWERAWPTPLLQAARNVYKGSVPSKIDTLGNYTFCLCFDNVTLKGWITEKIFDCFVAGTVPIYWGASDVESYVPPECFIDMRQFGGYKELRQYLKSLSPAEIQQFRDAGRAFMRSPRFTPFRKQTFTELLGRIVEEDTGLSLRVAA